MATEYDRLMAEMDTILAKAQAVDTDEKIAAAADGQDMPGMDDDDEQDGEGDDDSFMKSFAVTLEDGQQVEAYDATEMLKSMHGQAKRMTGVIAALQAKVEGSDKVLARMPTMLKALQDQLAEQATLIKALRDAPGGRRGVSEAPQAHTPSALPRAEVLAKALSAQAAGRLNGVQVSMVETSLNSGRPIPEHIAAAMNAA